MSLQTLLTTALAGVASGNVYAQMAPADISPPFVVWRILSREPVDCLNGSGTNVRYLIAFECYATSYPLAITLAASVASTIDADSTLTSYPESSPGEEYVQEMDYFMEPVYRGFWAT